MFFLVGLCSRVFVNTSSILALNPNQEHQYIRIVKTKRMVKTVFRISFFFFLKFKIQLLFYVNPRVTVMKVLLFVFAGAMVDLSTPLVSTVSTFISTVSTFVSIVSTVSTFVCIVSTIVYIVSIFVSTLSTFISTVSTFVSIVSTVSTLVSRVSTIIE